LQIVGKVGKRLALYPPRSWLDNLDWRRAVKLFSALKVIGLLLRKLKIPGSLLFTPVNGLKPQ